MEQVINYIKPELLILIPVLYFIGMGLKATTIVKDNMIPIALGLVSIVLATIWVIATSDLNGYKEVLLAVFVAITQGILCAGMSVYTNQIYKQSSKKE